MRIHLFTSCGSGTHARPAFFPRFAEHPDEAHNCRARFLLIALMVFVSACGNNVEVLGDRAHNFACDLQKTAEQGFDCQLAVLANRDRASHVAETGNPPALLWSPDLAQVARQYSIRMCEQNFFSHADANGKRIADRLDQAEISWIEAGENLAEGSDMTPEEVEKMFLAEPPCTEHRAVLMEPKYQQIGVGVVHCANTIIYTEIFAQLEETGAARPITSCTVP